MPCCAPKCVWVELKGVMDIIRTDPVRGSFGVPPPPRHRLMDKVEGVYTNAHRSMVRMGPLTEVLQGSIQDFGKWGSG